VKPLGSKDVMLVMLSGHGQELNGDAYFCPVDAVSNDAATQVSLTRLIDKTLAPNVGRKMLLVDACRDVPRDQSRRPRGIQGRVISLPEETAILYSCRSGQTSLEDDQFKHGLFTECVIEALQGAAARKGEVSWFDMVAHVTKRMEDDDMRKLIGEAGQLPIAAGGVRHTVLARITIKPDPTPTPNRPRGESEPSARLVTNTIGMKLSLIPAGEFQMGSPASKKERTSDEQQHHVKITKPFYLGVYETTQGEFQSVMGRNPSSFSATGGKKDVVAGGRRRGFPSKWSPGMTRSSSATSSVRRRI
jgi:hypothetical protein